MTTTTTELAIGTPVRYWTGVREGDGKASRTRTTVQPLGGPGGTLVVWVEGEGSCIAITHVQEITAEELQAEVERRDEEARDVPRPSEELKAAAATLLSAAARLDGAVGTPPSGYPLTRVLEHARAINNEVTR